MTNNIKFVMDNTVHSISIDDAPLMFKIGDSVYVDNNETFEIKQQNNMIELVDSYGMVEGSFRGIKQLCSYLSNVYDKVEIIKKKTVTDVHGIISDELAYLDNFHDEIYKMLIAIGKTKGYRIEELYGKDVLTNEILADIRDIITEYLNKSTASHIDLSPPVKEYKLGDKVSLYHDGVPVTATIVDCGYGDYGLFIDGKYKIAYIDDNDSPTNYILALQKRINVE